MNQIHMILPYFLKIHFNIILPSKPGSSKWFLPFKLSDQNVICISHVSYACYMPCKEGYKLWSSSFNFLQHLLSLHPPYVHPQYPVLKHPQSVLHAHAKQQLKLYSFVKNNMCRVRCWVTKCLALWNSKFGPDNNFTVYLRRHVLSTIVSLL
jgi:hypothetical protein